MFSFAQCFVQGNAGGAESSRTRFARAWKFRCFIVSPAQASEQARQRREKRGSKNPPRYKSIRGTNVKGPLDQSAGRWGGARTETCRSKRTEPCRAEREAESATGKVELPCSWKGYKSSGHGRTMGGRPGYGTWWAATSGGEQHTRTVTRYIANCEEWGSLPCTALRLPRLRDLSRTLVNYD